MRLAIIAVGKLKDAQLDASCGEYEKRAKAFLPIERLSAKDSASAWEKATGRGGAIVVMDERGECPTSPELAAWLGRYRDSGTRSVSFLIGDADGWSDADRARADRVLSLSRLTLPHRVAQLVLCEQLYRAGTILAGHPYHHG